MGGVISYLLSCCKCGPKIDTTPDPTTGLTKKDREVIAQTWKVIANTDCVKSNAAEFFIQLFITYPYTMEYFEAFKGTPLEELRESPKLRAHATSVFCTITSYVDNIDDPGILVGLFQKIAESHIDRGITVKEFENFKTVFLKFLKSELGSKCTPQVESAWNKLFTTQNSVFQAKADELAAKSETTG